MQHAHFSLVPPPVHSAEMSKLFSKHFHLCFFKLKYPTIPQSPPSATHKDSLYDVVASSSAHPAFKSTEEEDDLFSSSSDSDTWETLPPLDLSTVISSQRFFFSSPGRSNSIIEYTRPCGHRNRNSYNNNRALIPKGGVEVTKHSVDPYVDFRRSMQEMIDSRDLQVDVRKDWDYLRDLLSCYLALNHPHNHRYIVRAFTDLVVDLSSSSSRQPLSSELTASHCRKPKNRSLSGPLV